jgi:hypothetical protein
MAESVNQVLSEAIHRPHDPDWHDHELLTPAGEAAHAARVRALAGNRQARLDLEARWEPVLKDGAAEDAPVIDPWRNRTQGDLTYPTY